jgi:hypothetical protein
VTGFLGVGSWEAAGGRRQTEKEGKSIIMYISLSPVLKTKEIKLKF